MMGSHSSNTFTKLSGVREFVRQDEQKRGSKEIPGKENPRDFTQDGSTK
jgi:hypothetical protein